MKITTHQSANPDVKKYVFEFDSAVAESVLYRYQDYHTRTVICCSTQSGCPVGCRFCGAGDAFVRSLTSDEILAQIHHLFADNNITPDKIERCQIMFMSMGEPMLNFGHLETAIDKLYMLYPRAALLISTIGPDVSYSGLLDLSIRVPTVGLQFSIHESNDVRRNKLIPFKRKMTLNEIATVGKEWNYHTGRNPFFNYCAHDDNTSELDADNLLSLFDPNIWNATISVICERDETIAAANARQQLLASDFQTKLTLRGYNTRMFDPAGQDDIGGGCGQLWYVQNWMKQHPELTRPSVGNNLPIVHTPR